MNKKELEKDLTENKSDDLTKEKSEEIKEETPKKKEQSNGMKMFKLLLATVVVLGAFIIYRSGWNPFKSKEVSKESAIVYEKAEETVADIFEKTNEIEDKLYGYGPNAAIPPMYEPNGECPYGFEIKDYGKEGNNKGIQREMRSVTGGMREGYGTDLWIYYTINEDYAIEKYKQEKIENLGPTQVEYDFENGQIAFGKTDDNDGAFMAIRHGTKVYYGLILNNERYEKAKQLPKLLGFNFEFPNKSELFTK